MLKIVNRVLAKYIERTLRDFIKPHEDSQSNAVISKNIFIHTLCILLAYCVILQCIK